MGYCHIYNKVALKNFAVLEEEFPTPDTLRYKFLSIVNNFRLTLMTISEQDEFPAHSALVNLGLPVLVKKGNKICIFGIQSHGFFENTLLDTTKLSTLITRFPPIGQISKLEVQEVPVEVYEEIKTKKAHVTANIDLYERSSTDTCCEMLKVNWIRNCFNVVYTGMHFLYDLSTDCGPTADATARAKQHELTMVVEKSDVKSELLESAEPSSRLHNSKVVLY